MNIFKAAVSLALGASMLFGAAASAGDIKPCPDDYKLRAVNYIESRLDEPRGARVQIISEPYRIGAEIKGYEGLQGWGVDIRVKSRLPNGSYGTYVPYTVIFIDGHAVALADDTSDFYRV